MKILQIKNIIQNKYFSNAIWLIGDKVLKMLISLFVMIYLARYLGPEQFGIFNYALSTIALMGIFVYLGLSGVLVHELLEEPKQEYLVLGTAFYMKELGAIVAFLCLIVFVISTTNFGTEKFYLLLLMGIGLFLKPFEVFDSYNESKVLAKYSAKARSYSFLISSVLKIIFITFGTSILYIGLTIPFEMLIMSIILIYYYQKFEKKNILDWQFSKTKAKYLIHKSWKLIFSFIFVTIYLKTDQLMLSWMINDYAVGIYSVASTLSEAWYFVPAAIVASIYPKLVEQKKQNNDIYKLRLQQIYDLLFFIALIIAIVITFYSTQIINLMYGEAYKNSSSVLTIHIWAGIFVFMRSLFSRWIIIEDLLMLSIYSQGFGALLNIILNLFLIEEYGVNGAAIATLISYCGASYLALFIHKSSRSQAKMMTLSLLLPLRLIILRKNLWKN